jgi:hypothetical protein
MLNITYKPLMLSVIMLNITYKPFLLSVSMLSAIMLNVAEPFLLASMQLYPKQLCVNGC